MHEGCLGVPLNYWEVTRNNNASSSQDLYYSPFILAVLHFSGDEDLYTPPNDSTFIVVMLNGNSSYDKNNRSVSCVHYTGTY